MSLPLFPATPDPSAHEPDASGREGAARVARVAVPLPIDEPLDYLVPPALASDVRPGTRVTVPIERRRTTGVVLSIELAAPAGRKLRAIEAVVDPEPALPADLLRAIVATADDVLCPIGIALASALPPGSAPRTTRGLAPTTRGREALARGALRADARSVLEQIARGRRPAAAARRIVATLRRDGLVEEVLREIGPRARVRSELHVAITAGVDVEATCAGVLARAKAQARLLRALARSGPVPAATLSADAAALRALVARGLVTRTRVERPHDVLGSAIEPAQPVPELTADQAAALAPIVDAVALGRAETFLLHGVTGSGKTEIYLRAVAAALRAGRQALVLVPEITLTHQILARLRGRFGDRLAVLHSGLGPGERLEQWLRLRRGETPIAVGARSALFAPVEKLGLVVIDEEHDSAYKNEEGFRWHARDLARRRAEIAGCPVVLGSATPALESRFAADQGGLSRLVLPSRIGGRPLPAVEIVDLARERASTPRGRKLILTRPLRRAIESTLAERGQAILLLNRRGFSTRIYCFDCGHAERCAHCDVSLVFHVASHSLRCHYCGYETAPPDRCSGCGAPDSALLGLGTERVEEEVRARFPQARVGRLDRDVVKHRGAESVLADLRDGRIDVLVGTQMVAKGHDFPGVRLVGVIAADVGLHLPDFRAAERTFQLLTQVAGRAGRGSAPGQVVLQTFSPDHYAIRPVATHDYETFYASEIRQRAELGYPPCGRLGLALVDGPELEATTRGAERLVEAARAAAAETDAEVAVHGPLAAPFARLRDRHRLHVLVRASDTAAFRRAMKALSVAAARVSAPLRAHIDVDPHHML